MPAPSRPSPARLQHNYATPAFALTTQFDDDDDHDPIEAYVETFDRVRFEEAN